MLIAILTGLAVYSILAPSEEFKWWWHCKIDNAANCDERIKGNVDRFVPN